MAELENILKELERDRQYLWVDILKDFDCRGDVVDCALQLLESEEGAERIYATEVLRSIFKRISPAEQGKVLAHIRKLGTTERDMEVLSAVCEALGSFADPSAFEILLTYRHHPSSQVRQEVATSLLFYNDDAKAIKELLGLIQDPDCAVREWATFSLGESKCESEEIREALWNATKDECEDVELGALKSLAKRRDPNVKPIIRKLVKESEPANWVLILAQYAADPELYPTLVKISEEYEFDDDPTFSYYLSEALKSCHPNPK